MTKDTKKHAASLGPAPTPRLRREGRLFKVNCHWVAMPQAFQGSFSFPQKLFIKSEEGGKGWMEREVGGVLKMVREACVNLWLIHVDVW